MPSPANPAAGRADCADYFEQLVAIREDPQVKRLARPRTGDPGVAEDALQETFYVMAMIERPERIDDIRKYFCKVLVRNVYRLQGQQRAVAVDDAAALVDARGRGLGGEALPATFDEEVHTDMLARKWLERFAKQRAALTGKVPGRSPEPDRYRDVIVTTAEGMLLAITTGDFRDVDLNLTVRAAYPEWFAERGVATTNIHQRLTRARADVGRLLRAVIRRCELDP